jgi:FAD/FMN-containing dehydrogenase
VGRYATDASIYQQMPVGVFVPRDGHRSCTWRWTSAARWRAHRAARRRHQPVRPDRGRGLVIDHSKHMRRVIDVDVQARTATVEPGLVLDHLNAQLKPHGLWYPVDVSTSAQATLGGMAGNNSCGSRSSPTATWCTTCWAPGLAGRWQPGRLR